MPDIWHFVYHTGWLVHLMLGARRLNPIVAVMVYDALTVACRST
jgi:hypothetical protein